MAAHRKRSRLWMVLGAIPLLGGAAFFSLRALSRTPPKIDAEKLAKVERIDLARSVVATGKIEPTTKVEIKSKASGIILKLPVNVGDVVRQGQVICELDQNDLLPRVRQAQAALGMAEAQPEERPRPTTSAPRWRPPVPTCRSSSATWSGRARCSCTRLIAADGARRSGEELRDGEEPPAVGDRRTLGVAHAAIRKAEAQVEQSRAQLLTTRGGSAQRHHRFADRRRGAFARPRGGRRGQFDPDHGVGRDADHDGGRSARGLRQGQGGRERYRQGLPGTGGAHHGGIVQGPEVRRQGHQDLSHGRGEGQRHHVRSAGFDFERVAAS